MIGADEDGRPVPLARAEGITRLKRQYAAAEVGSA